MKVLSAVWGSSWLVRSMLCWKVWPHAYRDGLSSTEIPGYAAGCGLRLQPLSKSSQCVSLSHEGLVRGTATGGRPSSLQRGCTWLLSSGTPQSLSNRSSQSSPSSGARETSLIQFSNMSACESKSSETSSFSRNSLPSILVSQSEMRNIKSLGRKQENTVWGCGTHWGC